MNEDRMEYVEINRTYNRRFIDRSQKERSIDSVTQTEKLPEHGIQNMKFCGGKHGLGTSRDSNSLYQQTNGKTMKELILYLLLKLLLYDEMMFGQKVHDIM